MYKTIFFLFAISLIASQVCDIPNCDRCAFADDGVTVDSCDTCHGWYESGDEGTCVTSARLTILSVVLGLILICVIICAVLKCQEYRAKFVDRPTNIQSFQSNTQLDDKELNDIRWNSSSQKINDTTQCNVCAVKGGTIKLKCGHVFHGDCICWELKKGDSCPNCRSPGNNVCRIYCMKCLRNYMECPPQYYVQIKKRKSRVCFDCERAE